MSRRPTQADEALLLRPDLCVGAFGISGPAIFVESTDIHPREA